MTLYRIKNWDFHFENNKSRERAKCSFCCIPNKQDGLGYGLLLRCANGEALYGAFVAIVLICSKQKNRLGYLTADGLPAGCPLSARQLSVKCQFSEATIQNMLEAVSSNEIGWIEAVPAECPPDAHWLPAECPPSALEGRKEGRKEGEGGTFANVPQWGEFWEYCKMNGMGAEWYARDKFLAAESDNWRGKTNWTAYANRCRTWWENDGRPMSPTKSKSTRAGKIAV